MTRLIEFLLSAKTASWLGVLTMIGLLILAVYKGNWAWAVFAVVMGLLNAYFALRHGSAAR